MKKLLIATIKGGFFSLLFVLFGTMNLSAQSVSGTIKDDKGEPLVGAAVLVKGTSNGTITDVNGAFKLDKVAKGSTLVVSFVGYNSQEVNADGNKYVYCLSKQRCFR